MEKFTAKDALMLAAALFLSVASCLMFEATRMLEQRNAGAICFARVSANKEGKRWISRNGTQGRRNSVTRSRG